MATTITLACGAVALDLDLDGGRLTRLTFAGANLLVGTEYADDPYAWGSYPMVPWAGRVRRGRFTFDGVDYQLPINWENHAIHGVGATSMWTLDDATDTSATVTLEMPDDERWPFGGTAWQTIAVSDTDLMLTLGVRAQRSPMPVALGWHPWFVKPTKLRFQPESRYVRDDDYIATGELVPVPPEPWDDCFVNRHPVGLTVNGVEIELSSDCTDWVVYSLPRHGTCVEPQSGPPNALNIAPRVIQPGESFSVWHRMTFRASEQPTTRRSPG